uniref:Uncharacterized protein n=1 Tax=Arundo donax TaxID=35708 RepID=A0A0A9DD04_ARUDO
MWESGCNRSGGVGRRLVSTVDQGGSAEIRSSGTVARGGGIQPVSFVYGSGGDGGHLLCRLTRRRRYWVRPVLSPPLWPAGCCSPKLHHHRSMPVWRSAHRRRRGGGQGDAVLTYVQRARPVHTAASCGSPPTSVAPPPPFFAVRGGSWAFAGAARWQGSRWRGWGSSIAGRGRRCPPRAGQRGI